MKNPILSIGGPLFIAYTLYDFVVVMVIFLNILSQGARANECDFDFKEHLIVMKRDIIIVIKMARRRILY